MTKARDLANASSAFDTVTVTELEYIDGVTSAVQTQIDSKAPVSTTVTLTDSQTLTNKTLTTPQVNYPILKAPEENCTVSATAATGTIAFDTQTQGVLYYTSNASANWTVNFRGNSGTTLSSLLAVGDSITCVFLVTQGSTAYYNSAVQIDGSSVTPKWQGGVAPSAGNASSIDAYSYTIIKTAATPTYTIFASQTKFA